MFDSGSTIDRYKEPFSFLKYTHYREVRRTFRDNHQRASETVAAHRDLKPIIAETSPNCRSTYLIGLNSTSQLAAACHGDRSVAIYCSTTGRLLAKCVGHEKSPWTLMFHPSHPYLLASGCLGGSIRLWNLEFLLDVDISKVSRPCEVASCHTWRHSGAIASIAFHPTQPILAAAWAQEVIFYDWISGRVLSIWRFVSDHSRVRWVKFAPDGALLYTATANPSSDFEVTQNEKPLGQEQFASSSISNSRLSDSNPFVSKNGTKGSIATNGLPKNCRIPRDGLLEFLVRQCDDWFHQLDICMTCAVRLCCWAGTLGPTFPTTSTDIQLGVAVAHHAATVAAATTSEERIETSFVIQQLLMLGHTGPHAEFSGCILSDANPGAVAIIEDMPAQEFLLSRGNYCHSPPQSISSNGLCCGGHAFDLLTTHRELMRHSLCRPCLSAFWCWANKNISWWTWTLKHNDNTSNADSHLHEKPVDKLQDVADSRPDNSSLVDDLLTCQVEKDSPLKSVSASTPVGICIQCQATMTRQLGAHMSVINCERKQTKRSHETDFLPVSLDTNPSGSLLLPLAALDLLRSRLSNAHQVTPITYLAPDLIFEGLLSNEFKVLLSKPNLVYQEYHGLPSIVLDLVRRATYHSIQSTISNSPIVKRRKISGQSSAKVSVARTKVGGINHPLVGVLNEKLNESQLYSDDFDMTNEAATFGSYMKDVEDQNWNHPNRALIRDTYQPAAIPNSTIFPYVSFGSSLLHPAAVNPSLMHNSFSDTKDMEFQPTDVVKLPFENNMTACCRCGHIVPEIFPVDPQSNLSVVVCERLVFSDGQLPPVNPIKRSLAKYVSTANLFSTGNNLSSSCVSSHPSDHSTFVSSSQEFVDVPCNASLQTKAVSSIPNNSMYYLIDQTNNNSMMDMVGRSITEVISGLFVDMGEYGAATSLHNVTYRICRWELNFCSSMDSANRFHSSHYDRSRAIGRNNYLPMPANMAISYNTNSLIIPHARLFNDSSISLSRDGHLLAAFIVRRNDCNSVNETKLNDNIRSEDLLTNHKQTSSETILAVYRLQSKNHRSRCSFIRRFSLANPVCLDFSPLGDFLVVGLATTRMPLPQSSDYFAQFWPQPPTPEGAAEFMSSQHLPYNYKKYTSIAYIYRLERSVQSNVNNHLPLIRCSLKDMIKIKHPLALDPISSHYCNQTTYSVSCLDRWHRLLLSTPNGLSLNTIVWSSTGSILYGTTKGLVVIMQGQSSLLSPFLSLSNNSESSDKQEKIFKTCANMG